MNKTNSNSFINDTIFNTPKPTACSTLQKKIYPDKFLTGGRRESNKSTDNSLGILSLNSVNLSDFLDTTKDKMDSVNEDVKTHLEKQCKLAYQTLEKSVNTPRLPSRFLKASLLEESEIDSKEYESKNSTISETDLLEDMSNKSNIEKGLSQLQNHSRKEDRLDLQNSIKGKSLSANLSFFSEKIRNSDINLKDLCEQMSSANMSNFNDDSFKPLDDPMNKLLEDELSWKNHNDMPVLNNTEFSQYQPNNSSRISLGQFFQGKCQNLTELSLRKSPTKKLEPVPLIDQTFLSDYPEKDKNETAEFPEVSMVQNYPDRDSSLLSLTKIARAISNKDETPSKALNYLLNNGKYQNQHINEPSKLSYEFEPQVNSTLSEPTKLSFLNAKPSLNPLTYQTESKEKDRTSRRSTSSVKKMGKKTTIEDEKTSNFTANPDKLQGNFEKLSVGGGNCYCKRNKSPSSKSSLSTSRNSGYYLNSNIDSFNKVDSSKVSPSVDQYRSIPNIEVSKDSGYSTAQHFDNNSVPRRSPSKQSLDSNKENMIYSKSNKKSSRQSSPQSILNKSSSSVHTESSWNSNGKLPIESTKTELVWDCIKVGKSNFLTFVLRNRSQKRLKLSLSVTGSSFRILGDRSDSELLTSLSVLMHPLESKSFSVSFTPTAFGACVEQLNLQPFESSNIQISRNQRLMLYGYGGHANLEIQNVAKDIGKKLWLSLGHVEDKTFIKKDFVIYNSGTLPGFVSLNIVPKHLNSFICLQVTPSECTVQPGKHVSVTVTYKPTKEDMKHINRTGAEVLEIGTIKLISGSEVLRGRIRRLGKKVVKNNGIVEPLITRLSSVFPDESMPRDLNKFNESVGAMKELLLQLVSKEILLTVEHDPEKTLIGSINETTMFQTLCCDSILNETSTEDHILYWTVEPKSIVLTPPMKCEDAILLSSKKKVQFQVKVSPQNKCLRVVPLEGIVDAEETTLIRLYCDKNNVDTEQLFNLSVLVENDVIDVNVKVFLFKKRC